jgi:hypothetical protein
MLILCSSKPGQIGGGSGAENLEVWAGRNNRSAVGYLVGEGDVGRVRPELIESLVGTVQYLISLGERHVCGEIVGCPLVIVSLALCVGVSVSGPSSD